MKVIIAGGRDFQDYDTLKLKCNFTLSKSIDVEVVSGTCKGVDLLGERYAKEKDYPVKQFPADWSKGKSAGPIRNKQMAEYADGLIAFWDGKSKGTKNMIDLALSKGLKVQVYNY
ncbi:GTP-binding domain [Cellulophaga phage phi18:3]|uniref:YspA cpYpsA-related SLOG domain-containing protein n=1 Tax=Cellulophaga phage phi18:3 TaxID=1327983 RepID=S0A287_9CAUD|nr:GTP-binding domain [Cellulophaga phage phi18:3]AGO48572.1 hypothetical protein Phi18:3_gp060 [Cellulophaga phage phi18:3]